MSRACAPACRSSASTSSSRVAARETRSPSTSPSRTIALVVRSVAVSKARISTCGPFYQSVEPDTAVLLVDMLEPHRRPRRRETAGGRLRPLDEDDRVLEVRLEIGPLRSGDVGEAVEVEVRDVGITLVAVADRVGRARDGRGHAEGAARPPNERGLAGAQVARHRDDVARLQLPRERGGDGLRLLRRAGDDLHEREARRGRAGRPRRARRRHAQPPAPSATGSPAGSATRSSSRASNSGIRAKSAASTPCIDGV